MRKLALATVILITALVSAFITSLFWIAAYSVATPVKPVAAPRPAAAPSALAIPVAGVRAGQLRDTFAEARGQGRPHDAIDIVAPRGALVVAAGDGVVERLFFSRGGGGITAYVRSRDRLWIHYYAHLDAYAPGLREGQNVRRGDPLGTVGSTGNANPSAPHLHFAIHRMDPNERWWQGRAINPYPLLATSGARR